ncbi:putative permease protein of ABC transporter system [Nostocoides japonicum T1-X7]|uniref:Putative permease protein of ABC transporter system n=1 Tax=Nostocoides japonicum T1-X7 TaxID=1194083 RepID=A0A077M3L5_9MICO|nr:ABC transporter permease subunit [Tetrasphaera japonica]CCH78725.1 putative permease protein of ABC transporter system [Tetrasphaera japonica T1-X7]
MTDAPRGRVLREIRPSGALLGVVPFFAYVTVFLLIPTLVVLVGAFVSDGRVTMGNIDALWEPAVVTALWQSVVLSAVTAVVGAVVGGLLAYAVSTAAPGGVLRRFLTSLCGVLAQFGGVALAFAFLATFGAGALLTTLFADLGIGSGSGGTWIYEWNKGLMLVYLYFQIPLMLIVFLPAVEGLKPQWREATETLGGSTFTYWRRVAAPILMPSFIGALLLLFTNAFSAYATAAALVSQGSPLLPLQIGGTFTSEVVIGQANVGKAMALEMMVVVAVVMAAYAILDRRASRWLVR